jgi:rfaE bifunctional protein kinase chain/domain/rfaE bifunctional protein nucleotidyltransferase chain/domain
MQRDDKIKTIEELAKVLASLRAQGNDKKVVQCHGVFDLLHIGHIRHFEQAKKLGDVLVVTVTPDRYVNKGPHRPAFTEGLRAEAIAALDCVDYVAINEWPTAVETIKLLKPNIYAKGADYGDPQRDVTGKIVDEEDAVTSVGGKIAFTDDIVFSSSSLINKYLPVFPREVREYLSSFSAKYSVDDILSYLEKAQSLKVLVVGEAIIDEYQYCETIGKSAKEPILAARYLSTEKFAGGILAIANHVANFCNNVGMLTILGAKDSKEDFVRQNISSNVDKMFLYKANSPTIVKRRFIEGYLLQKIFEVYEINDEELNQEQDVALCTMLEEVIPKYDVVIVADYGHGMLTRNAIELLCNKTRFLVVNTQANASNRGFNTISRYPRADYVSLSAYEIALEERNRKNDLREMILNVSRKLDCGQIVVTCGKNGSVCYSEHEGFVEVPAFAHQVVDRMGSGDAVLSLTSLCVAQGAPMAVVGFIGNVAGAQAVATLGHQRAIERVPLFKFIESLLK